MAPSNPLRPSRAQPHSTIDRPLGQVLEFMRLMWAINHHLDRTSRRMYAQFGVTGPQRLVIRLVGTHPGLSAGDLARTLHVHPSTLTGILQRLEERGLLRRRSDPSDARRVLLELSARGRRLAVPGVGTVESAIKRTLAKWSAAELENTRRALTAISYALDDGEPPRTRQARRPHSR